jgi:hypothetical protein
VYNELHPCSASRDTVLGDKGEVSEIYSTTVCENIAIDEYVKQIEVRGPYDLIEDDDPDGGQHDFNFRYRLENN